MNIDLAFKGFLRLLKSATGQMRGGKYLNRKWTGKRWDYEYMGQKKKSSKDTSTPSLFAESGIANKTSVNPVGQDKPVTLSQESRAAATSATQIPLFGKKKVEETKPVKPSFSLIQEDKTSGEKKNAANASQGGLFGKKTDSEAFTKKDFKPEFKLEGDETISSLVTNVKNALLKEGLDSKAREFVDKAFKEKDLDSIKNLASQYVEVKGDLVTEPTSGTNSLIEVKSNIENEATKEFSKFKLPLSDRQKKFLNDYVDYLTDDSKIEYTNELYKDVNNSGILEDVVANNKDIQEINKKSKYFIDTNKSIPEIKSQLEEKFKIPFSTKLIKDGSMRGYVSFGVMKKNGIVPTLPFFERIKLAKVSTPVNSNPILPNNYGIRVFVGVDTLHNYSNDKKNVPQTPIAEAAKVEQPNNFETMPESKPEPAKSRLEISSIVDRIGKQVSNSPIPEMPYARVQDLIERTSSTPERINKQVSEKEIVQSVFNKVKDDYVKERLANDYPEYVQYNKVNKQAKPKEKTKIDVKQMDEKLREQFLDKQFLDKKQKSTFSNFFKSLFLPTAKINLFGLPITIERKRGTYRTGKDVNGIPWATKLDSDYGYIRRTYGADGEHIDCYVGQNPHSELVFVVNQKFPTGRFDEHKVMLGYDSKDAAIQSYLANNPKAKDLFDSMEILTLPQFKKWLMTGSKQRKMEVNVVKFKSSLAEKLLMKANGYTYIKKERHGNRWKYWYKDDATGAVTTSDEAKDKQDGEPKQLTFMDSIKNFFKGDVKKAKEEYQKDFQSIGQGVPETSFQSQYKEYFTNKEKIDSYLKSLAEKRGQAVKPATKNDTNNVKGTDENAKKKLAIQAAIQRMPKKIPGTNIDVNVAKKLYEKYGNGAIKDNFDTMPEGEKKETQNNKPNQKLESKPVDNKDNPDSKFKVKTESGSEWDLRNDPKNDKHKEAFGKLTANDHKEIAKKHTEIGKTMPDRKQKIHHSDMSFMHSKKAYEATKAQSPKPEIPKGDNMPAKNSDKKEPVFGKENVNTPKPKLSPDERKKKVTEMSAKVKQVQAQAAEHLADKKIESESNRLEENHSKYSSSFKVKPANEIKTKSQYTSEDNYDKPVIEGIKQSILANGYDQSKPITIDSDGYVVDGHHRFTAVSELIKDGKLPKDTPIPTITKTYENEAERLMDQVSANKMRRTVNIMDDAKAYSSLVAQGKTPQEISDRTGESVDKIRNTIALNNLIPELQHLLNSDHMSDKKRKDNSDGTRTKQESLGQGIAISIARNGVDDDGKPNGTIQRKAFAYANQNKGATPSQVADYIKTLKSQNFNFGGGIDEKGRSREQQEALRNVGGDEGKAHANASKAESFIKDTHNALSKLFGASTGEIDPKLMKELTNSIVGARGEGKAQSLQDHIDTMVKTLVAARDMIKNNLGEIKGNASMDDMFAFGKSTLWKQRVLHELNYRIHLARKLK